MVSVNLLFRCFYCLYAMYVIVVANKVVMFVMLLIWFRLLSQWIISWILLLFFCDSGPTEWAVLDFVP